MTPMPLLTDCTDAIGVPLVYDRGPDGYGIPYKASEIRFKGTDKLRKVLGEIGRDFKTVGWLPYIKFVLTAGLYVDKKGGHGDGTDIDIDGVMLRPNPFNPMLKRTILVYANYIHKSTDEYVIRSLPNRLKTRLACLLSLRLPVVLTAGYNKAHEDHIHASIAGEVGWRGSRSQVVCLQETLNAWFDTGLAVDGVLGNKTRLAWREVHDETYFGKHKQDVLRWLDWLKMIAFYPPKDVK